ncbi:MAG TPA: hypothetical protein PKD59_07505 [Miltoncostaeaceae bacterium]|nr:hypothetical protein [Miltoncostaeaceae bacterium]
MPRVLAARVVRRRRLLRAAALAAMVRPAAPAGAADARDRVPAARTAPPEPLRVRRW